jgi:hypothetical protein
MISDLGKKENTILSLVTVRAEIVVRIFYLIRMNSLPEGLK